MKSETTYLQYHSNVRTHTSLGQIINIEVLLMDVPTCITVQTVMSIVSNKGSP